MVAVNGSAVQTSLSGNGQNSSTSEAAGPAAAAALLQEFLQVECGSAQAWKPWLAISCFYINL